VNGTPLIFPTLFTVLALIFVGCATSPTVSVPAQNTAPGISFPSTTRVLGQAAVYVSEAGKKLEVIHDTLTGSVITKLPDGRIVLLPAEIAGSEGRYRDKRMTLWEHDGGVVLWVDGKLEFSGSGSK